MVKNIEEVGKDDHSEEEDLFNIFMGNSKNQFESDIIKSRRLFLNAKVKLQAKINTLNVEREKYFIRYFETKIKNIGYASFDFAK